MNYFDCMKEEANILTCNLNLNLKQILDKWHLVLGKHDDKTLLGGVTVA